MAEVIIRKLRREDCAALRKLIQELAEFQKILDPRIDCKTLEKDGFDGHPLFFCNVATFNEKLIGYIFFTNSYASCYGKTIFVDDLYVSPEFRGKRVGSRLINSVTKYALESGCCRIDFMVLNWNPATEFYKALGAIDLTVTQKWHYYRLSNLKN